MTATFLELMEPSSIVIVTRVNVLACQMWLESDAMNAQRTIGKLLVEKDVKLVIAIKLGLVVSSVIR